MKVIEVKRTVRSGGGKVTIVPDRISSVEGGSLTRIVMNNGACYCIEEDYDSFIKRLKEV